jgi:hypothetical protein
MGRKRDRGYMLQLDSLTDISTCMLGCLMMIILLTGIDAAQIKVLIPTPMEHVTSLKPVFIECRNDELFLVPVAQLQKLAMDELNRIAAETKGDTAQMLQKLGESAVQTDEYKVDLTFVLLGQFAVVPIPTARGYRLEDISRERLTDWYGRILTGLDRNKEMLTFLVRDDSYKVFKLARALAWNEKVEVSYELLDLDAPVKFGLGGSKSLAQ